MGGTLVAQSAPLTHKKYSRYTRRPRTLIRRFLDVAAMNWRKVWNSDPPRSGAAAYLHPTANNSRHSDYLVLNQFDITFHSVLKERQTLSSMLGITAVPVVTHGANKERDVIRDDRTPPCGRHCCLVICGQLASSMPVGPHIGGYRTGRDNVRLLGVFLHSLGSRTLLQ